MIRIGRESQCLPYAGFFQVRVVQFPVFLPSHDLIKIDFQGYFRVIKGVRYRLYSCIVCVCSCFIVCQEEIQSTSWLAPLLSLKVYLVASSLSCLQISTKGWIVTLHTTSGFCSIFGWVCVVELILIWVQLDIPVSYYDYCVIC